MDEDGYLTSVDRTKDMIIVGGFKVFSSKVEDVLSKHPAFSFDGNEESLKEDIKAFAKEKVAPYEAPKIIEIIEEMPLTAVGKIDKKVLRVK